MLSTAYARILPFPSPELADHALRRLDRLLGVLESLNLSEVVCVPTEVLSELSSEGVETGDDLCPGELIERIFEAQTFYLRAKRRKNAWDREALADD